MSVLVVAVVPEEAQRVKHCQKTPVLIERVNKSRKALHTNII